MFNHGPSSASQKANRKLSFFAFAFSILLFLSGCKSAEIQALENSVSVLQLTSGREISRSFQDKNWGFSGPIYPQVRTEYEPINTYTKQDVYTEIVAILEKNHWQKQEWNTGQPGSFRASLQQGQFKIVATVLIRSDKNLVTVQMIIY